MPRASLTLLLFALAAPLAAQHVQAPVVDDGARVTLANTIHPRIAALGASGPMDPATPLERMLLVLKREPGTQASLDRLLRDQQDPASPRYHQWLTPEAFGEQFGPPAAQVAAASAWLRSHGLRVDGLAPSGMTLTFSGTAAQVGRAFGTRLMEYQADGATHHANATSLSIPEGLAGFVSGVASLHDFRRPYLHTLKGRLPAPGPQATGTGPQATAAGGTHYVGAEDFAALYNLGPAYAAGATGKAVTIGIVGRTDLAAQDYVLFQSLQNPARWNAGGFLQVLYNGPNPGFSDAGERMEAAIDTQWSSAVAPGAKVLLVVSGSSYTTDGVDLSAQYLVDNNLAPVISVSFGACEAALGTALNDFYTQLWAQAAGQGISVFVSTGDNGAAGCDDPSAFEAIYGRGVSGIASTPFNTAVGGTQFVEGSSAYWTFTGGTGLAPRTVTGPIPEAAWNESNLSGSGYRLYAGSGGVSAVHPKPSWQAGPGVPADGMRDLPDVALNAASGHDGSLVCLDGDIYIAGGTSVAAPCMAGMMALVVQQHGRQGNANPGLYRLAQTAPAVFRDITAGTDSVPGVTGHNAGPGYDLCTGLGSVDGSALVQNWAAAGQPLAATVTQPGAQITVASGTSLAFIGSAPGAGVTGSWAFGDGATAPGFSAVHTYVNLGSGTLTRRATLTVTDGVNTGSASVTVVVTPGPVSVAITAPWASPGVLPGLPLTFTARATSLAPIVSTQWDFGDGFQAATLTASHAFGSYALRPYTVTFSARDANGASASTSMLVVCDQASVLDCNGDGARDVRDLLRLAASWGTAAGAGLVAGCDLNGDARVDDTDLDLWLQSFVPVAP